MMKLEELAQTIKAATARPAAPLVVTDIYDLIAANLKDPEPIIAEGRWYGEIIDPPRGDGGFGYDPYFLDPELGLTGAEMSIDQKGARSHRGKALAKLIAELQERLG